VPDVERGALDRLAARDVDDTQPERERSSRPSLGDVAAYLVVVEVVGAFGLLRREDAAHEAGSDRSRAGARFLRQLPGADDACAREQAAELQERIAAGESVHVLHGPSVASRR
jgi:hypothetical protein